MVPRYPDTPVITRQTRQNNLHVKGMQLGTRGALNPKASKAVYFLNEFWASALELGFPPVLGQCFYILRVSGSRAPASSLYCQARRKTCEAEQQQETRKALPSAFLIRDGFGAGGLIGHQAGFKRIFSTRKLPPIMETRRPGAGLSGSGLCVAGAGFVCVRQKVFDKS